MLLTVMVVVPLLTFVVFAVSEDYEDSSAVFSKVYINPLYEDEEINDYFISGDYQPDTFEAAPNKIYEDLDDVADYLRECFASRQSKITFYMKAQYNQSDDIYTIADVINQHTDNPRYGDSIAFQYSTFRYSCRYMSTRRSYYYSFDIGYYTTAEQEAQFDEKLASVLQSLDLDGMSEYRKVSTIYDYIVKNVSYNRTSDSLKYTAYNALCNGSAVCQGYSLLFYRMCMESGIDSRIITGYGNGEAHAWNIVRIGEKYYLCDSTWDAPIDYNHEFFLKSKEDFVEHEANEKFEDEAFTSVYPIAETSLLSDTDNIDWSISNGVLNINSDYDLGFEDGKTIIPWSERKDEVTKVVVEGDIRQIGSRSFEGLSRLNDVSLNEDTKSIGYWCFSWCSNLKSITLPDSVEYIGRYAFYNCSSLSSIRLPANLTVIDNGAFYNCTSLKNVVLPDGIKKIGANAFACPIDTITIPRSIDSPECIASNAFAYKARLTVRCEPDSYAIEYCKKYNIKYVIVEDIAGDVNEDGVFNDNDLEQILDCITGETPINKYLMEAADISGDGVLDIKDFNIFYSKIHG